MSQSATTRDATRMKVPVAALSIFAVALLAYLPAIRGGFVWDDDHYVTAAGLRSWHGLWRIWFDLGATQQYFPLLHTAFWVEHRFWGGAAIGYHLANVLLHASAAGLLALVLRRLAIPGAYLAALIFALHPVEVESVAWIAEQKNTLSAVFFLASALTYLNFDRERTPRLYAGALGFFVLALATKTVTAPLPAALLVIFWWQRGRLSWLRDVLPLAPWLALGAAAGLFSAWVEHSLIGAEGTAFALGFGQRCLVAGRLFWFYLAKLFWPTHLAFVYPRWTPDTAVAWQFLFPLGAVGLIAALWRLRRVNRGPLAATLLFVGLLFPVLGFLNVYWFIYSFAADHFQYLASMAVIALLSAGWSRWRAGTASCAPAVVAVTAVCVLGAMTWRHCRVYGNVEALYRTTLDENPACWMVHNNLGNLLRDSGRVPEAMAHYREALRLRPDALAHYNLGVALADIGKNQEAIAQYEEALRLVPHYVGVHYDLALALANAGRLPEAIAHYEEALRLKLDLPEVHVNLANALAASDRPFDAIAQYQAALRLKPEMPDAQNNWGNLLLGTGSFAEAIPHFEEAVRLKPDYPEAHYNLGIALAIAGRSGEAMAQYEQALRLRPNYAEAEDNLGAALAAAGRLTEAIAHYEKALQLAPRDRVAHYDLGLALRAMGRTSEAEEHFMQAARLKAGQP